MDLCSIVFRGKTVDGYFMDNDGNIYSNKRGTLKKMSFYLRNGYPGIKFSINGKSQSVDVHRAVAETKIPVPLPEIEGLTEEDIANTPVSVMRYLKNPARYQVNHIDHNKENFHPSNLEWVTTHENSLKYQEYRKKTNFNFLETCY